jgi:hypothetical protein
MGASTKTLALAAEIMEEFALSTGLAGRAPQRRYLWTDAFAVANFLGLHRATGEGHWLDRALGLIDEVHHVLGRHRPDSTLRGWLSALPELEGERHPTAGGLRIGKPLPERPSGAAFEAELEWDRDGQYFHYLTQWMHALVLAGDETGQEVFLRWASELARVAYRRFVLETPGGTPRLAWKMSIDLTRPLVRSSGQHDALDGWLAIAEIAAHASAAGEGEPLSLGRELVLAQELCADGDWATEDPLGAGALLLALHRADRLPSRTSLFLERLTDAAEQSLMAARRRGVGSGSAEHRLAFRELGLAIGLHAIEALDRRSKGGADVVARRLPALLRHRDLAEAIDAFWSAPAVRRSDLWKQHADINSVMLATSLAPWGYLGEEPQVG